MDVNCLWCGLQECKCTVESLIRASKEIVVKLNEGTLDTHGRKVVEIDGLYVQRALRQRGVYAKFYEDDDEVVRLEINGANLT